MEILYLSSYLLNDEEQMAIAVIQVLQEKTAQ